MKLIKTCLAMTVALVAVQSHAVEVPISFPKGSYCGSYYGGTVDKNGNMKAYTLTLKAKQSLRIKLRSNDFEPIVRDPRNKIVVENNHEEDYVYTTPMRGKYKIYFNSYQPTDTPMLDVEICAY